VAFVRRGKGVVSVSILWLLERPVSAEGRHARRHSDKRQ
jgi:hypothetical protein